MGPKITVTAQVSRYRSCGMKNVVQFFTAHGKRRILPELIYAFNYYMIGEKLLRSILYRYNNYIVDIRKQFKKTILSLSEKDRFVIHYMI